LKEDTMSRIEDIRVETFDRLHGSALDVAAGSPPWPPVAGAGPDLAATTYGWLMAGPARGDAFDRHVLACLIAAARAETQASGDPLNHGLGLTPGDTAAVIGLYFPHATGLMPLLSCDGGAGGDALEEEDLRDLLLDHRARGVEEEVWLAAMVSRRSLRPNHLWQDLGLGNRGELSRLLTRHFAPLAARNTRNMKWKKFFYRELCQREGVVVCKSPHCEACDDHAVCFGPEDGMALLAAQ
jgi:nitrogen fixation protein NifQ